MNRITSIEFLRFIFMLQISLWHFNKCLGCMEHGYIAVDFFFVLSGYLLFNSFYKDKTISVFDYTLKKIKRFYPKILISSLIYLLCTSAYDILSSKDLSNSFLGFINDIFLLSGLGVVRGGLNPPLWYVSVLVLGGGIIYALIKRMGYTISLIFFLLISLLTYTFIFSVNNDNIELWSTEQCFYIPFWRGIAGMGVGCILCWLTMKLKQHKSIIFHRILDILSILSFVAYFIFILTTSNYDPYVLLCISVIVFSCFQKESLINRIITQKFWCNLGNLTFEMLIYHTLIFRFIIKMQAFLGININVLFILVIYITILLLFSYFSSLLYNRYISGRF